MSIEKYERACELITRAGGGRFSGPKPESLVAQAETALELTFPPSYRRFVLELGCGHIRGLEVYGVANDDFQKSTVPNGIWLTLNERRSFGLNPAYVLLEDGGDGGYYALDTREVDSTGENPVVILSVDYEHNERVANSFGAYFLDRVTAYLSHDSKGQ